nr:EOG090X04UC [Macrothrix elegans]
MLEAVEKVSESFSSSKEDVKKSLISKLEAVTTESEQSKLQPFKVKKQVSNELSSLLSTMKVDISKPKTAKSKLPEQKLASLKVETLFSAKPKGLFKDELFEDNKLATYQIKTWDELYKRELDLTITHPPENGFQQMIMWTKQGKLWQFPIDNEQGLDEEAKDGFHEHIFLEPHLEPWCPKRGPIRHFMELVITGLSKNPYLTVAQKKNHIFWFRDFFDSQRSILVETGALAEKAPTSSSPSISS